MSQRIVLGLLLMLALGGCAGGQRVAGSDGACGGPPAEPGPDGCALICRAAVALTFDDQTPQVPVWINDRPAELILDTGAGTTAITQAAATRLGLGVPHSVPGQIFGIGGSQARRMVDIQSLAFGDIRIGPRALDVVEFGRFNAPPSGSLGADILSRYEVELDLPHNMLRLYQGRACAGPPPGWRSAGIVVPFGSDFAGRQPVVPIRLDGQPVQAVIDSGAGTSGVSVGFARSARVSEAELASELATVSMGIGSGSSSGRLHQFRSLDVGDEHVPNFEADVLDLKLHGIDVLLGDDYLRTRKVWLSYAKREMRVSSDW